MQNLSEEEKKAIEYFKYQIELAHKEVKERQNDEFKGQGTLEDIAKMKYCNFLKILNLIEKQDKQIEHLKKLNEHQSKDITKAVNYTFELNKEIELKDKMIDVMADCIAYGGKIHPGEPERVKEYFRKKAEANE